MEEVRTRRNPSSLTQGLKGEVAIFRPPPPFLSASFRVAYLPSVGASHRVSSGKVHFNGFLYLFLIALALEWDLLFHFLFFSPPAETKGQITICRTKETHLFE